MSRTVNFLKEDTDIFAGVVNVLTFAVVDDDNSGAVVDITGWVIQYDQKDDEQNPDAGSTISKAAVVTDGPGGILTVTLDAADTSPAAFKTEHNHFWSLVRTTPTPVTMLGEGRIFVKGSPFSA